MDSSRHGSRPGRPSSPTVTPLGVHMVIQSVALHPQRDALVEAGVDDERFYEDKASGRLDDRPGLAECLDAELNKDLSYPVRASVAEESTSPGTAVVPDLLAGLRWTSGAATAPPLSSRTFPSAGDAWIG